MTDSEKMDLILLEIQGMKSEMREMKADIRNLKEEMQEVKADIREMRAEMQEVKADIQNLKADIQNMKADIENMKTDIRILQEDVQNLKEELALTNQRIDELDRKTANISLHLENWTDKNIQLIAENFIELTNKLNEAIPVADKNLAYEVKVNYLIIEVEKIKKEMMELKNRTA